LLWDGFRGCCYRRVLPFILGPLSFWNIFLAKEKSALLVAAAIGVLTFFVANSNSFGILWTR